MYILHKMQVLAVFILMQEAYLTKLIYCKRM